MVLPEMGAGAGKRRSGGGRKAALKRAHSKRFATSHATDASRRFKLLNRRASLLLEEVADAFAELIQVGATVFAKAFGKILQVTGVA
jgi:hypothetical protein